MSGGSAAGPVSRHMHSLKGGGEPGGGWAAGARALFLALLLCDAGQATEASVPLGSLGSQHSAAQIPPWPWPALSLCSDMPGWGEAGEGILKYLPIPVSGKTQEMLET